MAINYNRNILNSAVLAPVNAELEKIEEALKDGLSLSGCSPNTPSKDIDMNSQRLFNLPAPVSDTEPLRKSDVSLTALQSYVDQAKGFSESAELASTAASDAANSANEFTQESEQYALDAEASANEAAQSAATLSLYRYITDAQELAQGNYELGASNTYTLPVTPATGTTIQVRRLFGFTPIVNTQGTNNMTFTDGSTDTTLTIDVDFPIVFVWNSTTWEVK